MFLKLKLNYSGKVDRRRLDALGVVGSGYTFRSIAIHYIVATSHAAVFAAPPLAKSGNEIESEVGCECYGAPERT